MRTSLDVCTAIENGTPDVPGVTGGTTFPEVPARALARGDAVVSGRVMTRVELRPGGRVVRVDACPDLGLGVDDDRAKLDDLALLGCAARVELLDTSTVDVDG